MAKPENKNVKGGRPSLYDIKRVCLSGDDVARLLKGQAIHASNGKGGDYATIVFDGSNPQAVDAGVSEFKKNLTEGSASGIKK